MSLEQEQRIQKAFFKRRIKISLTLIIIVSSIGAAIWYYATRPKPPPGEIISRGGIHWHPALSVYIKGIKQEVPANIGIGFDYKNSRWWDPMMNMTNIHTHDASGTLHWEVMDGPIKKEHITLKAFFTDVWGKQFNSSCIFEFCNGHDGQVKMFVNGQENTEFQSYLVKDKDKIEIKYE